MNAFLQHTFALVCGQNAGHTWAPAGELLPVCQRCTGLYVGATVALVLHLVLRPPDDARSRWLHGCCLLLMAPFGFHLVHHGPGLRTLTGQLFGFGVIGFLWLLPKAKSSRAFPGEGRLGLYVLFCGLSVAALPMLAVWGGWFGAAVITWLAFFGLTALAVLTAANLYFLFASGLTWLRRRAGRLVA